MAVGVDGCKSGWIAAVCIPRGEGEPTTSLKHFRTLDELALWRAGMDDEIFVTIDIPIGLPESTRFRRCDEEARRRLGDRRNAVFMPPGRYLLAARDHTEARELVKERRREEPEARGIGAQAWGIVPKIHEVGKFLHARPERQEWLLEVHPEVCFLEWSGRLLRGKHSAVGQIERLRLVREEFPQVERTILKDLNATDKVDFTDVLDAHAALWTALRRTTNKHETLAEETLGGLRARMIV